MKCPHCKKVPYPAKNADGSWNKKNVLRVEYTTILAILLLAFLSWGYKQDMAQCFNIVENAGEYCVPYCEATVYSIGTPSGPSPLSNYTIPPLITINTQYESDN